MTHSIFIDGAVGTTGLEIAESVVERYDHGAGWQRLVILRSPMGVRQRQRLVALSGKHVHMGRESLQREGPTPESG